MPGSIPHYGVWTLKQDPKSPHIYLYFTDSSDSSSSKEIEAAINVRSTDKDSRLVFWLTRNFSNDVTQQLDGLSQSFHLLSTYAHCSDRAHSEHIHSHNNSHHHESRHYNDAGAKLQGLDYIRTQGLVNIKSGSVLPTEASGPNNDIMDELEPILTDAINQKATVYIFGSSYGSGIHDIHMNQGSLPSFENGIYEDGALLFKFADGHWEAVFLAFASQRIPTNDKGEYESNSQTLASILGQTDSKDQ
ncbi:conserved hypothetical protein [Talaromyces stipitatus ATCC 10500]|uniref:Uncharacterized protein n=1 Tax=Talaromyces stipitatus (strain ATCC 10500 / CBS 375.48 / QM 6759 / NRRL 1006) TaxID=441959 RepID=B8M0D6_TALSN|nr:uncharacterized protein TSTA_084640 [Talaromyces stipitatus ATCC 10500]EED21233.1 conserved hypothetical protein [Talaromyces stipitatus ATCC 10500]